MSNYILLNEDKTEILNSIHISNEDTHPFSLSVSNPDLLVKLEQYEYWDFSSKSVKQISQNEIAIQEQLQLDIAKTHQKFDLIRKQSEELFAIVDNSQVTQHGALKELFPDVVLPVEASWYAEHNVYKIINILPIDPNIQYLNIVTPYFKDGNVYSVEIKEFTQQELDTNQLNNLIKQFELSIILHLNIKVQERNYDSIISACTYDNSTVEKFKLESLACIAWRDAIWSYCYQELDKIKSNTRQIPSIQEFINELPELVWPN